MFHLVLASNASMQLYPDNTATDFTTHLPIPLELDGEWKVGLKDMAYPNNFRVKLGPFSIGFYFELTDEYILSVPGARKDQIIAYAFHNLDEVEIESIQDFVQQLNECFDAALEKHIEMAPPTNLENIPTDALRLRIMLHKHNKQMFKVNLRYFPVKNKVTISLPNQSKNIARVQMRSTNNPDLLKILGLESPNRAGTNWVLPIESKYMPTIYYHNSMVFAYCDIIDQMICGDTMAEILSTMPLKKDAGEKMQYEQRDKPMFRRINKKYISTINIWLAHESGDPIRFPVGKTILTLEFRKRF